MKQNITIEHFNQLNQKGQKRLIEWCNKKHYRWHELSIGQMIEFVNESYQGKWPFFSTMNEGLSENDLVEGLWRECKKILNNTP